MSVPWTEKHERYYNVLIRHFEENGSKTPRYVKELCESVVSNLNADMSVDEMLVVKQGFAVLIATCKTCLPIITTDVEELNTLSLDDLIGLIDRHPDFAVAIAKKFEANYSELVPVMLALRPISKQT